MIAFLLFMSIIWIKCIAFRIFAVTPSGESVVRLLVGYVGSTSQAGRRLYTHIDMDFQVSVRVVRQENMVMGLAGPRTKNGFAMTWVIHQQNSYFLHLLRSTVLISSMCSVSEHSEFRLFMCHIILLKYF